ncbi:unnamed protein product, partial [Discosporangium mesarthrocarpum]
MRRTATKMGGGEDNDPLYGERLHAWVLIRGGKREENTMSFVEPTTGAIYPTGASPYLSLEAVFNSSNFWANVQTARTVGSTSFDLLDGSLWEYAFIDPVQEVRSLCLSSKEEEDNGLDLLGGEGGEDKEGEEEEVQEKENILDLPPSWVNRLHIDRDLYSLQYPPHGHRTIIYQRAKVELMAENIHSQGMTRRLTVYKDRLCTIVKEIRETFVNRTDQLYSRVLTPLEGKVSEWFRPGRADSLRNFISWSGRRREIHFFVEARLDGLVSREEDIGRKIIQRMKGRPDGLTYRSVNVMDNQQAKANKLPQTYTLPGGDNGGDLVVYKMAEKYERNRSAPAEQDVSKRTFYLSEGRIHTIYHHADDNVTSATKMHFKDNRVGAPFMYDGKKGGDGSANAWGGGGGGGGDGVELEETLQDVILAEKA